MTISFVGVVGDEATSGSLSFVLPTVSEGDACLIAAECADTRTLGTPAGFTNTPTLRAGYPQQGGTNGRFYLWQVKLVAADSGHTITIAPDASNKIVCCAEILHSSNGFDTDFIDDTDFEQQNATDTTYTAPASTSTVAGDWAVMFFGDRGTNADSVLFSTPAGLTKRHERYTTGTGSTGLALFDSAGSIGGASTTFGPKDSTGISAGAGGGITVLVKEIPAAAPVNEFAKVIPIVASTSGGGGGPSPLLVPAEGCWMGVCPVIESLASYEARVGRLVEDQVFKQWGDVFPTSAEMDLTNIGGRIMFWNWKAPAGGWGAIASGTQDAVIDACAARFAAFGKRCFLTFHHEPENDVSGFGGSYGTAADYRGAWRRIVPRFKAAGATNVIFVWKVMGTQDQPVGTAAYGPGATGGTGNSLWPGDDVIDWLMYDPYNRYGIGGSTTWRMPLSAYDPSDKFSFYDHSGTNWSGKPLGIAETGTQEHDTLSPTKAEWILDVLTQFKTTLPRIRAYYYFQAGPPANNDYKIHTSPEAEAAMVSICADPYFNPTRPTF